MRNMAADFYEKLFTSEGSVQTGCLLQYIDGVVSKEMNARLTAAATDEEIEATLFQMGPTKATVRRPINNVLSTTLVVGQRRCLHDS